MNRITKLALVAAIALPLQFSNAAVVINEIYGGGGNAGAPFNQDYVELFNNGIAAIDISGFTLQYASAAGSFTTFLTFGANTFIQPGDFLLISAGSTGPNGSPLPPISFTGSAGTNFSATAGRIQLMNGATTVDLVGYGATAVTSEGAPAPAPSNTTSISRTAGLDTNNNNLDFTTGAPTPIPEPATYMLFGIGLLACAQRFRRAKANKR